MARSRFVPDGRNPSVVSLFATPGTFSYVVPQGVTSLVGEGWGSGGGASGTGNALVGGGGGAGGGYSRKTISVTPGETLTIVVPVTASVSNSGSAATISRGATVLMRAGGGNIGLAPSGATPGLGGVGVAQTQIGDVTHLGGDGASGGSLQGGGAGSGADSTGAGNSASGGIGGPAKGTMGGKGSDGQTLIANATPAGSYGGGGGGRQGILTDGRVLPAQGAVRISITV